MYSPPRHPRFLFLCVCVYVCVRACVRWLSESSIAAYFGWSIDLTKQTAAFSPATRKEPGGKIWRRHLPCNQRGQKKKGRTKFRNPVIASIVSCPLIPSVLASTLGQKCYSRVLLYFVSPNQSNYRTREKRRCPIPHVLIDHPPVIYQSASYSFQHLFWNLI